jgi:hypothetical protein
MPVIISTALPDGDVLHKVQYGQSLWSIATAYHTTVEQIRAWNNLEDAASINDGYLLLVQKGATQPAPSSLTPSASAPDLAEPPTATPTTSVFILPEIAATSTPTVLSQDDNSEAKSAKGWMMVLIFIVFIGGILSVFLIRSPEQPRR